MLHACDIRVYQPTVVRGPTNADPIVASDLEPERDSVRLGVGVELCRRVEDELELLGIATGNYCEFSNVSTFL